MNTQQQNIVSTILDGGLVILGTDTIYGMSCSINRPDAIERIYATANRDTAKAMIVLIADYEDLNNLCVVQPPKLMEIANQYWPGKISILFPVKDKCNKEIEYLHRGTNHLAIRLPDKDDLRKIIRQTGPIVSTSVNPQGQPPALTIEESRAYFGNKIDFYADEGRLESESSTLISLENGVIRVLRQGAITLD